MYEVSVALLARDVERGAEVLGALDEVLINSLGPAKEERTGGLNSYDPDLVIEGWGSADLPDIALAQGPATAQPRSTIEEAHPDIDAVPDE